jgi:hypothetical protein
MTAISVWLKRVPFWVWLFLAVTQVVAIFYQASQITKLDESIAFVREHPQMFRDHDLVEMRGQALMYLVLAAVLYAIFGALTSCKWTSRR